MIHQKITFNCGNVGYQNTYFYVVISFHDLCRKGRKKGKLVSGLFIPFSLVTFDEKVAWFNLLHSGWVNIILDWLLSKSIQYKPENSFQNMISQVSSSRKIMKKMAKKSVKYMSKKSIKSFKKIYQKIFQKLCLKISQKSDPSPSSQKIPRKVALKKPR